MKYYRAFSRSRADDSQAAGKQSRDMDAIGYRPRHFRPPDRPRVVYFVNGIATMQPFLDDSAIVRFYLMKRIILLLVGVVIAVVLAFMSLPEDPGDKPPPVTTGTSPADTTAGEQTTEQSAVEAAREKRLAAMKTEYAKLERAREDLRLRLQNIIYYLSKAELPDEQGGRMQDEILGFNRILVNPRLLGAFYGAEDILQERLRIENINQQLDEYEAVIREHGGYDEAG